MSVLVKKHTVPLVETCAMTRFGVILPAAGLRLDVDGIAPQGNVVMKALSEGDTPVTLRATAVALVGMPLPPTTVSSTVCPPASRAGVPTPFRLSISRTGETGMYRPLADAE